MIELKVADIDSWKEVKAQIENLSFFLLNREISLKLLPNNSNLGKQIKLTPDNLYTSVSLFSGGLDSGAYAVLESRKNAGMILSHTITNNNLYHKAKLFFSNYVSRVNPRIKMATSTVNVKASHGGLLNSRGFLFLTDALCVAKGLDIRKVIVPENGPMIVNPKVSSCAEPTKTTNQTLLRELTEIFNILTGSNIIVVTPFINYTKGEIIRLLADRETMAATYSCFSSQGQSKMCGLCLACLIRMLSSYAAGYGEDIPTTYIHNPFKDSISDLGTRNQEKMVLLTEALKYWQKLVNPESVASSIEREDIETLIKNKPVMRRHALEMLLGLQEAMNNYSCKGTLGKRARAIITSIDKTLLNERKEKLMRLNLA